MSLCNLSTVFHRHFVHERPGFGKVIDLSKHEADNPDLLKAAGARLSQQNNPEFHITAKGDADTTIHLTEKAGAIDYSKSNYDLTGTDGKGTFNGGSGTADATWKNVIKTGSMVAGDGKALTLQIGDTADDYNQLKVNVSDCHVSAIGIGDIDISTQEGAQTAVDNIIGAARSILEYSMKLTEQNDILSKLQKLETEVNSRKETL